MRCRSCGVPLRICFSIGRFHPGATRALTYFANLTLSKRWERWSGVALLPPSAERLFGCGVEHRRRHRDRCPRVDALPALERLFPRCVHAPVPGDRRSPDRRGGDAGHAVSLDSRGAPSRMLRSRSDSGPSRWIRTNTSIPSGSDSALATVSPSGSLSSATSSTGTRQAKRGRQVRLLPLSRRSRRHVQFRPDSPLRAPLKTEPTHEPGAGTPDPRSRRHAAPPPRSRRGVGRRRLPGVHRRGGRACRTCTRPGRRCSSSPSRSRRGSSKRVWRRAELENRLHLMTMQILSRGRLSKIITELDLYPEESKEMTREEVISLMRSDIRVEPVAARARSDGQAGASVTSRSTPSASTSAAIPRPPPRPSPTALPTTSSTST